MRWPSFSDFLHRLTVSPSHRLTVSPSHRLTVSPSHRPPSTVHRPPSTVHRFQSTETTEVPETITCVDCGETAHRLSYPPEDGWELGDVVAYRCRGCHDRWDLVVEESDDPNHAGGAPFDFRQWLADREKSKKNDSSASSSPT